MISPITTSSMGIWVIFPLRRARHFILEDSSCNLANASSLPYSEIVEINEAKNIAITMPTVSYQSKFWIKKIVLIASAIKRIFMIGSPSVCNKSLKKLSRFFEVIWLLPYLLRFYTTCLSVNPISKLFSVFIHSLLTITILRKHLK